MRNLAVAARAAGISGGMLLTEGRGTLTVPKQIKMFNIDLNWLKLDRSTIFAPSGSWAATSPAAYSKWRDVWRCSQSQ
jgi:hypothetical protein